MTRTDREVEAAPNRSACVLPPEDARRRRAQDNAGVQEVLGHVDIRTTRGYQRVTTQLTRRQLWNGTLFTDGSAPKKRAQAPQAAGR